MLVYTHTNSWGYEMSARRAGGTGLAAVLGVLVAVAAGSGTASGRDAAGNNTTTNGLSCGSTVATSVKLKADIGPCSGNGLVMSAGAGILDLNGHSVLGSVGNLGTGIATVGADTYIFGPGVVDGFKVGIDMNTPAGGFHAGSGAGIDGSGSYYGRTGFLEIAASSVGVRNVHDLADAGSDFINDVKITDTPTGISLTGHYQSVGGDIIKGGSVGIDDNAKRTHIVENRIDLGSGNGINVSNDHADIHNNSIANNGGAGIAVTAAGDDADLAQNVVKSNGDDGIAVAADGATILKNTVRYNEVNGIHVSGDDADIHKNTARSNGADGIFIDGDRGETVTNNFAFDNGAWGIQYTGGGFLDAPRNSNTATGNGQLRQCSGLVCAP
jgi:parallel beta-helix repeat protein